MTETKNYKLKKPAGSDYVGPEAHNDNMDTIDAKLKDLEDGSDSVKGAPILEEVPADNDHIAISDASDGGKTKRVLWSKIKALFAGKSHTHPAGDITPGIFEGTFGINTGENENRLRFTKTGYNIYNELRSYFGTSLFDLTAVRETTGGEPSKYTTLQLSGNTYGKYILKLLYKQDANAEKETFFLYGDHNKPVISGGYTGTGQEYQTISLGGTPTILYLAAKDSWGGISALAILVNFGAAVNADQGGNGIAFMISGAPTISPPQVYISGSRLYVGSGASTAAQLFNQVGVTYSYWGSTI